MVRAALKGDHEASSYNVHDGSYIEAVGLIERRRAEAAERLDTVRPSQAYGHHQGRGQAELGAGGQRGDPEPSCLLADL